MTAARAAQPLCAHARQAKAEDVEAGVALDIDCDICAVADSADDGAKPGKPDCLMVERERRMAALGEFMGATNMAHPVAGVTEMVVTRCCLSDIHTPTSPPAHQRNEDL